ncbi:gametocyte-specific factor 1-like [Panonychus citri]|uniref:gametocyte-specific factor 1-like n=1 Tax=Panonychus citri TaxID=50023 RepID=UPI00230728FE|nr:gametocyte-specific factor 1-like [Panonychus citri]
MGTFVDTNSDGPDQVCPYNKTHIISYRKFTSHILECAKNHNPDNYITCPYYAKHRVLRHEIYDHLQMCTYMVTGIVTNEQMDLYAQWSRGQSEDEGQQSEKEDNKTDDETSKCEQVEMPKDDKW